ncbi:phosphodiester glycosidase family protein [Pseudomonas sp. B33.4]|uniref:phosphodiester glycosidase family protein n=1 Tax=Pseudomonas sp. B33.4 TaxID=3104265 RepID=UPI002ADEC872|nr:phosphodiester glycosidase family protein [Pseudomonas sp. B33.4]
MSFQARLCVWVLISSPIAQVAQAATALSEYSKPHATESFELDKGTQVRTHRFGEYQLIEVYIPAESAVVTVHDLRAKGVAVDAYRGLETKDTVAIIGGGFFGYNSKGEEEPIGLTRVNGERKVALMPWSHGGVFASNGTGTLRIFPATSKNQGGRWKYALQSKPIIIQNGNVDVGKNLRDAEFNRVAVGLSVGGDILIVGLFQNFGQAATQVQFSYIYRIIAEKRDLKILRALAMDGGAGAQIHIPKLDLNFGDTGLSYFPNALRFNTVTGQQFINE